MAIQIGPVRFLEGGETRTRQQRKAQKSRSVVLNAKVIAAIQRHLHHNPYADERYLFTGLRGCLTVPTVSRLVKTSYAAARRKGNDGRHALRTTGGSWQRQHGADMRNLVEAVGPATPRHTMADLGLQPEEVR